MDTSKCNAGGNPVMGYHPNEKGRVTDKYYKLLHSTDQHQPDGSLGTYAFQTSAYKMIIFCVF